MSKLTLILSLMAAILVVETCCQQFIQPTYRPPPQPRQPVLRTARDVIYDDVKMDPNRRHARSLSTPGRGRIGSNDNKSGGSRGHDTGATHPGYNRRNARSLGGWGGISDSVTTPPFNPKPWPGFPKPEKRPRFPTNA